jgi:hypothetical protein
MASISSLDLIILGVRLLFAALLYGVVVAFLLSLRRHLLEPVPEPAVAPTGRAMLTLIEALPDDGPPGRVIPLTHHLTVGRREPCAILLRDDAVSGRHARFVDAGGRWNVEDLGSTNGTFVNGARISRPVELQPGDVITVGNASWRYELAP